MGRNIPDGLAVSSLYALDPASSYVPLEKLSRQITRTALTGDVARLDRLWQLLCLTYPPQNLIQCLNMPDRHSMKTVLMLVTEERMLNMVQWLLDTGSEDDGMTRTDDGDTILHLAAASGSAEIIPLYHSRFSSAYDDLEADIRLVDWRNDKRASPLCTACRKGSLEAVQTLLSLGASVDLEDNQGDTPLHYAASYGHLPIVRMLLHQGASAFAKNNLGYTASDVAFSFEVEQEIQNTVRSALEANKRLRSAKISAAAVTLDLRKRDVPTLSDDEDGSEASPVFEGRGNPMDKLQTPKSVVSPHSRTPVAKPLPSSIPPSLSILTGSSSTPNDAFATPLSKLLSCDRPQPSPSLDPESSKALQRILARDQNAQAGFHASTAYKGLVGPAFPSEPSISPYSNISKESGYFSSRAPVSMRRGRSSSNDVITGSYASSSATGSSSASSSPHSSLAHATNSVKPGKSETKEVDQIPFGAPIAPLAIRPVPPVPPLPMAPHTALPALMSNTKSSSSSFVNILKRSGSSSAAISVKPNGLVSPLDAVFPPDTALPSGKRSLKHHTSLADLRSHTAPLPNQNQAPAPQMPFISKGTFGFGKSRTRSGT